MIISNKMHIYSLINGGRQRERFFPAPLTADFTVNWVFGEKSGLSNGLASLIFMETFFYFTGDSLGQHLIFLNICQKTKLSILQKSKQQKL